MITQILKKTKLSPEDIICIFPYGSRVYGTARRNSDYDYILITTNKTNEQYSDTLLNINFYTPEQHQARLDAHEISALECHFLPENDVIFTNELMYNKYKNHFTFNLSLSTLRHSLSAKSSNSWAKAHKKLTIEADYDLDIGRKSLFHSMRIIEFGKQIAQSGKIYNYKSCNILFHEIMMNYDSWDTLFEKFKGEYNTLCSEFRIVAPK